MNQSEAAPPPEEGTTTAPDAPESPQTPPPPDPTQPRGFVTVVFMPDGSSQFMAENARGTDLWAASRLLDTMATRMWNDQRDAQLARERAEAAEVERVRLSLTRRPGR